MHDVAPLAIGQFVKYCFVDASIDTCHTFFLKEYMILAVAIVPVDMTVNDSDATIVEQLGFGQGSEVARCIRVVNAVVIITWVGTQH